MALQCNSNASRSNARAGAASSSGAKLTREQIRSVFLSALIPMVGFGFMDNFIMITAGSAIDNSLGVHMGLATMTAAAIGQVVSDVSGVVFGDTLSRCFKVATAKLSAAQKRLSFVRRLRLSGAVIGVIAGCTLGATALYLIPDSVRDDSTSSAMVASSSSESTDPQHKEARIREQLHRLTKVMNDVMTSTDDKWLDRRASCTLFVSESMGHCLPAPAPKSFFEGGDEAATLARLGDNSDPAVMHTLQEGRVVVFADTIYVPVVNNSNDESVNSSGNSNRDNVLGIFKIKLQNGSFYTGSEIKDAKRVARNLGFFLNHMM